MLLYREQANALMGKYNIDCTAMQVGHAMEMQKTTSDKIYKDVYDTTVKGLPSKYFHQTETYAIYKKNAVNLNDKFYQEKGRADSHKYTFGPNIAIDHAKNIMKLMSTKEYNQSRLDVNKSFKGMVTFSKINSKIIYRKV